MGRRYGSRFSFWPAYVPVAQRKAQAQKTVKKMEKSGRKLSPVNIEGRTIAKSFWGGRWCTRMEEMAECDTRLTKGRTYARNGSIIDLQISEGKVTALVMGSELYHINITIKPIPAQQWEHLLQACLGKIDSLIELMQGRLSDGVMEILTKPRGSLLPTHEEIKFTCTCPDYYDMCKHAAACLYGIGHRLDQDPLLLFKLRQVDPNALIKSVTKPLLTPSTSPAFAESELASLFGIEIEGQSSQETSQETSQQKVQHVPITNKTAKGPMKETPLQESMKNTTEPAQEPSNVQALKKRGRPKKVKEEEALTQPILSPPKVQVEEKPVLAFPSLPPPIDLSSKLVFPPFHEVPPAAPKPPMTAAEREQLRAEQDRRFQAVMAKGNTQKKSLGRPRKTLLAEKD